MTDHFLVPALIDRLGWTLAHFLWQGLLICSFAAAARLLFRRSAEWRYAILVMALFMMLAAPAATFLFYSQVHSTFSVVVAAADARVFGTPSAASSSFSDSVTWTDWAVLGWLIGVVICSIRLAGGWRVTQRLLQAATPVTSKDIAELFDGLAIRIGFKRQVRLLVSERIATPVVVGWLRPVVLLPLVVITGLDADQLRAILAHELAHIRRYDFLVNLMQRCVESLLYYHPAVWWLSAEIRKERENCCDDLAVKACGDPLIYAQALVELERSRAGAPIFAMAAAGGDVGRRVRRILGRTPISHERRETAVAVLLIAAALVLGACYSQNVQARGSLGSQPSQVDAWVLFRGDSVMMKGNTADKAAAETAHKSLGGDLVWFRQDKNSYVIQDPATVARFADLYQSTDIESVRQEAERARVEAEQSVAKPFQEKEFEKAIQEALEAKQEFEREREKNVQELIESEALKEQIERADAEIESAKQQMQLSKEQMAEIEREFQNARQEFENFKNNPGADWLRELGKAVWEKSEQLGDLLREAIRSGQAKPQN
jgi:beta-lactamase regulating signal transducer with metallopeptidase domain